MHGTGQHHRVPAWVAKPRRACLHWPVLGQCLPWEALHVSRHHEELGECSAEEHHPAIQRRGSQRLASILGWRRQQGPVFLPDAPATARNRTFEGPECRAAAGSRNPTCKSLTQAVASVCGSSSPCAHHSWEDPEKSAPKDWTKEEHQRADLAAASASERIKKQGHARARRPNVGQAGAQPPGGASSASAASQARHHRSCWRWPMPMWPRAAARHC